MRHACWAVWGKNNNKIKFVGEITVSCYPPSPYPPYAEKKTVIVIKHTKLNHGGPCSYVKLKRRPCLLKEYRQIGRRLPTEQNPVNWKRKAEKPSKHRSAKQTKTNNKMLMTRGGGDGGGFRKSFHKCTHWSLKCKWKQFPTSWCRTAGNKRFSQKMLWEISCGVKV